MKIRLRALALALPLLAACSGGEAEEPAEPAAPAAESEAPSTPAGAIPAARRASEQSDAANQRLQDQLKEAEAQADTAPR